MWQLTTYLDLIIQKKSRKCGPDEYLYSLSLSNTLWYTDYANYLASEIIPSNLSYQQKKKFFSDIKYYLWEDPFLFKVCEDGMIRRCVPEGEMNSILHHCHDREI